MKATKRMEREQAANQTAPRCGKPTHHQQFIHHLWLNCDWVGGEELFIDFIYLMEEENNQINQHFFNFFSFAKKWRKVLICVLPQLSLIGGGPQPQHQSKRAGRDKWKLIDEIRENKPKWNNKWNTWRGIEHEEMRWSKEMEWMKWELGWKPITHYSVIKKLCFLWRRQLSISLHSIICFIQKKT